MTRGILSGTLDINVLLAFVFGVIFISVILVFAAFFPNPSSFSQWVFVIVTALAGAGIGAVIPGILKINLPYVKAGGALAVFALVLLNKPALVEKAAKFVPPADSPLPLAIQYLERIDSRAIDAAWESLDAEAKQTVARDRAAYNFAYSNGRDPLGTVSKRVPMGTQELTSPNGYPPGIYRAIAFRTAFESGQCHAEQVVLRAAEDVRWRVFEHGINPSPIPCL